MMNKEIADCPFCGMPGDLHRATRVSPYDLVGSYFVECCADAILPGSNCGIGPMRDTPAEATAAWNKSATYYEALLHIDGLNMANEDPAAMLTEVQCIVRRALEQ